MKSIRAKGGNNQLPWRGVKEFGGEEFNGFCSDFEPKWPKIHSDSEEEIEDQEKKKESLEENTEEWIEANNEQVNRNEELGGAI